jgi:hypothetical protein
MITVITIYPETIGCASEYSEEWVKLYTALGYENSPQCIDLIPVKTQG